MATVDAFDRITVEPEKCGGKPGIRGMRITVRRVLELLATYPDRVAPLLEILSLEERISNRRCHMQWRVGNCCCFHLGVALDTSSPLPCNQRVHRSQCVETEGGALWLFACQ